MGRSTVVRTTARSILSIVQAADPEWRTEAGNPIEYEFSSGRVFRGRERTRGAYEAEE